MTEKARQYAQQVIARHPNKIHVYTDGSVRGRRVKTAGAGYVIDNNKVSKCGNVSVQTTDICIAEMSAIICALQQEVIQNTTSQDIVLFCDNQYVVDVANDDARYHVVHSDVAIQMRQVLFQLRHKCSIEVEWIPAHCNIDSHDKADKMAVKAAMGDISTV